MSDVKYYHLNFGPYLFKTTVEEYIIQKLLEEGEKTKYSYNYQLAGHLKNQFLFNYDAQKWFYNEIHPIINAYRNGHCDYHNLPKRDLEFNCKDLWINYMKPGDYNPIHTHAGEYSFVLFCDVPEELQKEQEEYEGTGSKPGSLTFEFTQAARPSWATTGTSVKPKKGDFYMFPSLLRHWVAPFKSNVTRISVSGNIEIKNRHLFEEDYF
jgi:uncharacterized protein (TIGR02466 family)